jgi:hypothetical protein
MDIIPSSAILKSVLDYQYQFQQSLKARIIKKGRWAKGGGV